MKILSNSTCKFGMALKFGIYRIYRVAKFPVEILFHGKFWQVKFGKKFCKIRELVEFPKFCKIL